MQTDHASPPGHECGDCGRKWTGVQEAHCAGCCRHFSSDTAFDAHLVAPPPFGPRPFGTCRDPAELVKGDGSPRLTEVAARFGSTWSWPGSRPPETMPENPKGTCQERFPAAGGTPVHPRPAALRVLPGGAP
jgi:hypothetical protein